MKNFIKILNHIFQICKKISKRKDTDTLSAISKRESNFRKSSQDIPVDLGKISKISIKKTKKRFNNKKNIGNFRFKMECGKKISAILPFRGSEL